MTRPQGSTRQLDAFSDRVMAAIALTPAPSPTRSFLVAIRAGSGRDAVAALTVAWHLATQRDWPVAPRVRARSLALVLAVASVLGTGSMVAASAARVLVPHVDRTEILEPRGSIIVEPAPDRVVPASSGHPHPTPATVQVPGVVSVAVSKKAPVTAGGQASSGSGTKRPAHGNSTSPHDGDSDQGDPGTPAGSSDDGDGTHQGDDGADPGTSTHDASDGEDTGHGSDDGSDGGDGHSVDDGGGTPDD